MAEKEPNVNESNATQEGGNKPPPPGMWIFNTYYTIPEDDSVGPDATKSCDDPQELPIGKKTRVHVSHVNSPQDFYVIATDQKFILNYIHVRLYGDLSWESNNYRPKHPELRTQIAAIKTEHNECKRVKILELMPERMVKVFFIDYGYEGVYQQSFLRVLPKRFEPIAPQAIHCTLDVLPPEGETEWPEDITNTLKGNLIRVTSVTSVDINMRRLGDDGKDLDPPCGLVAYCLDVKDKQSKVMLFHPDVLGEEDWGSTLVNIGRARRVGEKAVMKL